MSETHVVALEIGREPSGSMKVVKKVCVVAWRVRERDRKIRRDNTPRPNSASTASRVKPSGISRDRFTVHHRHRAFIVCQGFVARITVNRLRTCGDRHRQSVAFSPPRLMQALCPHRVNYATKPFVKSLFFPRLGVMWLLDFCILHAVESAGIEAR